MKRNTKIYSNALPLLGAKRLKFIFILFLLFQVSLGFGKVIYVAVDGSDFNAGDIDDPVETIKQAQRLISAGDTVYIRGGHYQMRTTQIAEYKDIWAYVTVLDKSGTAGKRINYWAYPGETPVFDYTNIKPANKRIFAFYVTGSYIHVKGIEVTGVQVTITGHTQSECFEIKGSNNIIEQVSMHDGMAIGVYILRGSNNLILNCDAYNNYDSVSENGSGGNTDGFGCHAPKGHKNNVFRGCRAWFNSDDGYDCISSGEPVLFDNCWAFYNGYSKGFVSRGDGNGIKAGGYGSTAFDRLPNPIPSNTIQFCLAVRNKQSGFYSNHHLAGSSWYNNTAYKNKRNFNMLNREAPTQSGYLNDVPGWGHVLKNNLGYKASYKELSDIDKNACVLSNNYFDMDVIVNDNDFLSLDESLLTAPRQADGSLPDIDFLKLAPGSDLINAGLDIGFGFNGSAPDLGCFETDNSTVGKIENKPQSLQVYPNPFINSTEIQFELEREQLVDFSIYSMLGEKLKVITHQNYSAGNHKVLLQKSGMNAGAYLLVAMLGDKNQTIKLNIR